MSDAADRNHGYFHHGDHTYHDEQVYCVRCGGPMVLRRPEHEDRSRLTCSACGFIFYQNPKVVVATVPEMDRKIVLVRRAIEPRKGTWSYPGGFLELGETAEQGALRETKEETNLDVALTGLLNVYSRPPAGVVVIVYSAKVTGGEPLPCAECSEIGQFDGGAIPWDQLSFATTEWALRDLLARR